jgi:hypothetical protein
VLRTSGDPSLTEYKVVVDDVSGGEIANILRGYILVGGEKIRFMGIAYGRYGGQNVAPRFSPKTKKRIREVFGDLTRFEEDFQLRMVKGDFEIEPAKQGAPVREDSTM